MEENSEKLKQMLLSRDGEMQILALTILMKNVQCNKDMEKIDEFVASIKTEFARQGFMDFWTDSARNWWRSSKNYQKWDTHM